MARRKSMARQRKERLLRAPDKKEWCALHYRTMTRVRTQNGKMYFCRWCRENRPPVDG